MRYLRILAFGLACSWVSAAPPRLPQFQDHAEYTLVGTIQIEKDPARKLVLLERWTQLFPQSAFRQERWNQYLTTYRALGRPHKMWDVARRMTADNPSGVGNYWITVLTVTLQDLGPDALDEARRAAEMLLRNAHANFSSSNCPSAVALTDWYKERDRQMLLAHRALGWVALQQKEFDLSTEQLTKVSKANPYDAEAWFWLGSSLLGPGKPELQSRALYCFARSLAVPGRGALLPEARRLVRPYFEHAYLALNGNNQGMNEFLLKAGSGLKPE